MLTGLSHQGMIPQVVTRTLGSPGPLETTAGSELRSLQKAEPELGGSCCPSGTPPTLLGVSTAGGTHR